MPIICKNLTSKGVRKEDSVACALLRNRNTTRIAHESNEPEALRKIEISLTICNNLTCGIEYWSFDDQQWNCIVMDDEFTKKTRLKLNGGH